MTVVRKHYLIFSIVAVLPHFVLSNPSFAEQVEAERTIKEPALPRVTQENKKPSESRWYAGTFYDLGDVVQGSRRGEWTEVTTWLGRRQSNTNVYGSFSRLKRFSEIDYTGNLGFDLKFQDTYFHEELGLGWDASFIYRFQNIQELSHPLYKNLYWQLGYSHRHYSTNDTHLIYPGLIYYFGDNYVRVDHNLSHIESRGTGQFVTLKGSFAINNRLTWDMGTSIGEWLYDINGLPPGKETGIILYTMLNFKISNNMRLGVGTSYGAEEPKFVKRSLNIILSVNF